MAVRKKVKKRHTVLKVILFTLLGLLAAAVIFIAVVISKAPDLSVFDVEPEGYMTTVLDTNGETSLTLVGAEANRVYVTLDQIPEDLQHAFVAIEDERFYDHHGIDIKGLLRAIWTGITTQNFSQGASTITQQLIKNNVFTDSWATESSFMESLQRKIQEQYLAVKLENMATKEWILENYLNTINLGGGTYGVETAARYYFNKDVSDLNLSECAVLASITKSPTYYNPLKNPENNAVRRELVLDYMLKQGYITQAEHDEAVADDVYTRIAAVDNGVREAQIMDYFQDTLVYTVIDDLQEKKGMSEEDAWDYLYRGGLTIYSTEDSSMQKIAEEEVNNSANGGADAQVALVILDNETGQVRAMVGGRGEKDASLIYNRATSSIRQPGSAIKVIGEYAAGIENGLLTLGTAFDDAPYTYSNGTAIHNGSGLYNGMITVRQAITISDNIVALKCFQEVGTDGVMDMLESFGISTLDDSDKVEALAIGGTTNGVTDLEMTAAYSTISRGGTYIEPVYYTKVVDHNGDVILETSPETRRVISENSSKLLTSALKDVVTSGTAAEAAVPGMEAAGKTGTSTDVRDAWILAFNANNTCGIWGGYDDNSPQEDSAYVKTIWKAVMTRINELSPAGELGSTSGLTSVKICTKCGKLAVDDLCDKTVQGDMTREEYYVSGTEPTAKCTCHQSITICTASGMRVGPYCPKTGTETTVYLASASEGTLDEEYVVPASLGTETCTTHQHFWSSWFSGGSSSSSEDSDDSSTGQDTWTSGNDGNDSSASDSQLTPGSDDVGGYSQFGGDSAWDGISPDNENEEDSSSESQGGIWSWFGGNDREESSEEESSEEESSEEESEDSGGTDWWPFW